MLLLLYVIIIDYLISHTNSLLDNKQMKK